MGVTKENLREKLKVEFLQSCGLGEIQRVQMKNDASFRRYERITKTDSASLILMDAPPEKEKIEPFMKVAEYLINNELSAPKIYNSNIKDGFLLLEDFGDGVYESIISGKSKLSNVVKEEEMYEAAIDSLIHLHKLPVKDIKLPSYDEPMLIRESMRFIDWYASVLNEENVTKIVKEEYVVILKHLISIAKNMTNVMVLRDYHAENLIWLKDRDGYRKAGLIDFQDAVIGSPVYDLVSLLEDARRDVSPQLVEKMINRYLKAFPQYNRKEFYAAYSIFGLQRNLKIIGFCAMQSSKYNNPQYLSLLPRVWRHINNDLKHPLLMPMKVWLNKIVPMQMKLYKP